MTTDDGMLARVALKFRQSVCGLHGHDSLLNFENGRMSLLCSSCGHRSPGWDVRGSASRTHHATAVTPLAPRVARVAYTQQRRVA